MTDEKTFPHKLYNDAQLQPIEEKAEEPEAPEVRVPEEEKQEESE